MRISDWSSDVCSSDLLPPTDRSRAPGTIAALTDKHDTAKQFNGPTVPPAMHKSELHGLWLAKNCVAFFSPSLSSRSTRFSRRRRSFSRARRSEEHTSELPSKMRISYDVFCSKNKKKER